MMRYLIDTPASSHLDLQAILETLNLTPSSPDELLGICQKAIDLNPDAAQRVRSGTTKALSALIGDVMRQSKGQADAKRAREILLDLLN
jgi:aspartyl-tRNA(Asn)/glutamyl-tRNA(Gln) amidotransferase subunit B